MRDRVTYNRAANAALGGLVVQACLVVVVGVVALYSRSAALSAAAWYLAGGLGVWAVLAVLYYQHKIELAESLEADRLTGGDPSVAELFDRHAEDLSLARRRLGFLYKWGLGGASLFTGVYLAGVGAVLLHGRYRALEIGGLGEETMASRVSATALIVVTTGAAFVSFIVARYLSGMTRVARWQLLRGGAGYLMGGFAVLLLAAGASLCLHFGQAVPMAVLGLVVPGVMVLAGLEMLVSLVLSGYRPRRVGEVVRPAFDSRVFGWLASPESIAKAVADALNYQFGVEVSRSWFYQLLNRAVVPLTVYGAVILLGLSCVVIVEPHEQAVVTRFGKVTSGQALGPGLHVKWFWPVGRARTAGVNRVHQVTIGTTHEGDGHEDEGGEALLWTGQHSHGDDYYVTAPTPLGVRGGEGGAGGAGGSGGAGGAVGSGVALVGAQVVVQYRVTDLQEYFAAADDPDALLTAMAERHVNARFVTTDIDRLLSSQRAAIGTELQGRIQNDVKADGLGIEVLFVGLVGVHPPEDGGVAAAFLAEIGALQEQQSLIEDARLVALETMASVAGSYERALAIDGAILRLEEVKGGKGDGDARGEESDEAGRAVREQAVTVERLLTESRGEAARMIFEARAGRWERVISERAKAERFEAELAAAREAPRYYRARRYLEVLASGLAGARKYVVTSDGAEPPVFRLDLKDAGSVIETIFEDGG